ncbi:chemotaxis protein CheX [Ornithinibacillus scapharcae]|uniref:chemotaxis protein CheX n=1 Tax=Ornithinibacillus scapharcae TaxID=1147159 RepID=UPI000225BB81|nr:chemotaxis protein CheX [Ornithinibacillus scapharcae]
MTSTEERSKAITSLLNGTIMSVKNTIPVQHTIGKPQLSGESLKLQFGVLIGITGDIKGKLVLSGESNVFSSIGEAMFGMPIQDEMLVSLSGELGNIIAGGLSTNIVQSGLKTDITAPTIIEGNMTISGYERVIQLPVLFNAIGELDLFLIID